MPRMYPAPLRRQIIRVRLFWRDYAACGMMPCR